MSLRERLKARPRPSAVFKLRMEDDTKQREELAKANLAVTLARNVHEDGSGELVEAERKFQQAQDELDACYEPLRLVALPPEEYEALLASHPPTEEQRKKDSDAMWNGDTFPFALIAVTVEGDMSEDDWREMHKEGRLNIGEFHRLFLECLEVNNRAANPSLGKG